MLILEIILSWMIGGLASYFHISSETKHLEEKQKPPEILVQYKENSKIHINVKFFLN